MLQRFELQKAYIELPKQAIIIDLLEQEKFDLVSEMLPIHMNHIKKKKPRKRKRFVSNKDAYAKVFENPDDFIHESEKFNANRIPKVIAEQHKKAGFAERKPQVQKGISTVNLLLAQKDGISI